VTRANPFDQINDPDSAIVQAALTRRCIVCKHKPGEDCTDIYGASPLKGRLVHYARTVE
jgi:hypothetical protein